MIKLIFGLKIDFNNWKYLTTLNQVVLKDIKKSFEEAHLVFGWKNLLNFICHTMKFQNCHYTNVQQQQTYRYDWLY